uniref:DUF2892 domain-containing protein n=1 Tax=Streptomyces sp. NBC_00180 TaxID=2903632 RepID=A0AAU1HXL9_9ACTN
MSARTPAPSGCLLALIRTGGILALGGSIAALTTGRMSLMGIAAVGFVLQFAGWAAHGRRTGGRR